MRVYLILRGGRSDEVRRVMSIRTMRARKVHHFKKKDRTQSARLITMRPTYHQVLRFLMMYSSASQEMFSVLAISLL